MDESMFRNWWKISARNVPWLKKTMTDFLEGTGIPVEIVAKLTLAELTESFMLANVMSKLCTKTQSLPRRNPDCYKDPALTTTC